MQRPTDHEAPGHDHDHGHAQHDHDHDHGTGLVAWIKEFFVPHTHDAADRIDAELETSREGIRALWISFIGLGITAILQVFVVILTNSIALLSDTLHNIADALTAIPLMIAFTLGRRAATRRYTYGYGRAEDLAGVFIVLAITFSAVLAGYESINRLFNPAEVTNLIALGAAGVIGFIGNEVVASYRIRVGRRIGSAALVADGLHARTDGLTSLAVLFSAIGLGLGWEQADAIIGLVITAMIVVVLYGAARDVFRRLLDAVDPEVMDRAEAVLAKVEGVEHVDSLRMRWIGHKLVAEADLAVDDHLSVVEAHDIAERALHDLLHDVHRLSDATVHINPTGHHSEHVHRRLADHLADA